MLQRIPDHKAKYLAPDGGGASAWLKPGDVVYIPAPGTKPPTRTPPVIDDPVDPARPAQK